MRQVLLFLFFSTTIIANAQIKTFSLIPEEFIVQLDEYMQTSSRDHKEIETAIESFKTNWASSALATPERQENVIKTCNLFLKKRAKPSPHFLHYIEALNGFAINANAGASYDAWNEGLMYCISKKNIRVADQYLNATALLLNEKTIYSSNSVKWKYSGGAFRFQFEKTPTISFSTTSITCFAKKDSSIITQTTGIYDPIEYEWKGNGGKVTWSRAGFAANNVFAELRNYNISMNKAYYTADSVTFTNKTYYNESMLGSFEEKIIANAQGENASYPRFDSYKKIFRINELYPGVDYKGGFSMRGAKFIGSGNKDQDAMLYFKRNDTAKMVCRSKFYVIKKDQLLGRNTAVTFYINEDSIYHPGLKLKYVVKNREVSLIRDDDPQSMSRSPYYNTYHRLDMDFELLTWQIDKPEILMGAMKGSIVSKSYFESENYFRESRYLELEMLDRMHPLVGLKRYAKQINSDEFYADEFAQFMKLPLTEIRHMCLMLSYKGIITYDINTDKIKIRQRLYDYIKARVGHIDYDVIKFDSEHDMVGLESANLRLTDYNLRVYGVPKIAVSDSQNVIIYPRGRQIILKKNRDFEFDGIIEAGLFTFFGQGFDFKYDEFKINLENIDSLKIKVESFEVDEYGMKNKVDIQNVVENITGELLIDDPHNKSSVKHFPEYPIFTSEQDSYVYYDYPSTQDGVYDRERFYFAIDPYEVDSLNSFTTQGLAFDGEFISADIFEPMRDRLSVQEDYSLGFKRVTGAEGYPVYQGKGTFIDTIKLSNRGLMGSGTINYLNSTTTSDEFVFLIDSMNGIAKEYTIEKQLESQGATFPSVDAKGVAVHWEPYNDVWDTEQRDSVISMYDGMATLEGGTSFTPKGLSGWGKFQFGQAQLTSDTYTFEEHDVYADTASFDLLTADSTIQEFAFKTQNIKAYVDFEQKKGVFTSNDEMTVVQFPNNKYICYLDRFSWDMETEEILLGSALNIEEEAKNSEKKQEDLGGAHFISVHPKQDTLNFVAPFSTYDLKKYIIHAENVEHINVADSRIFPGEKGKVTVHANARMETLKEAKILTPLSKQYHNIYDATLEVTGRMEYSGSGKYSYEDRNGQQDTLRLDVIGIDSIGSTFATGAIAEADSFYLSPEYHYQGKFRLNAERRHLSYNGAAKFITKCDTMPSYWIAFEDEINPNSIFIPISEEPKDLDKKRLFSGIYMKQDSVHIYSTFLGKRKRFNDIQIITAFGYLHYNEDSKQYVITNKDKHKDPEMPGNLLAFHSEYCYMYGEGTMDLGLDIGQVKMTTHGTITHNIPLDKTNLETVLSLDFFFPEELLSTMADTIGNNQNLKNTDLSRKVFAKTLNELVGAEKARTLTNEIQLYGSMKKLPEEMVHTMTFDQLDMYWDPGTKAYRSTGKIGIGNILGKQIHKQVKGYVEFQKRRTGDQIDIYLELSKHDWYFFSYTREVMQVVSSDQDFNTFIEELKDDKKKLKVSKKEAQYSFYLSSVTRKDIFIRRFTKREEDRLNELMENTEKKTEEETGTESGE